MSEPAQSLIADGGPQLLLVEDPDELYQRSRFDFATARIQQFQRPAKTGVKHSAVLLYAGTQSRMQWELHDPQFVAALPTLEGYGQLIKPAPGQPLFALSLPPTNAQAARDQCDIDPETTSTKRLDHGLYFRFIVNLKGQVDIGGFQEDLLDLCDEPWLEPIHPPRDHAASLQPFRYYRQALIPWQWTVVNYKAPTWRVEAEEDSAQSRRDFARDLAPFRQVYPTLLGPFPAVTVGIWEFVDEVVATGTGKILLSWSASPSAQGYRLYTNGVPASGYMPATQLQLIISGLALDTAYSYAIVPVGSSGIDAGPLSNTVSWQHSSSELPYVYSLSSDDPGPSR